jgi:hypothetical protein
MAEYFTWVNAVTKWVFTESVRTGYHTFTRLIQHLHTPL